MLERFARGKQPTQKNPLLAIVITPRKNRKFSVNFRLPLIYCKTLLVHTAVKDGLWGEGAIISWLKVPISGHCTFLSYLCTHQNQVWESKQCSAHYQTSRERFEQTTQGRSQGDHAVLPTSQPWLAQLPWYFRDKHQLSISDSISFPPCSFCWVLLVAVECKSCVYFLNSCDDSPLLLAWE